jgi:hypothetical protein
LLVAFFHERPAAVSNAFRVVSVYRISDAAMLSAAVLLRHVAGTDSLSLLFGGAVATAGLTATNATIIAILLIVAVACKSALLPFSSLRAMEDRRPPALFTMDRCRFMRGASCCCDPLHFSNMRRPPASSWEYSEPRRRSSPRSRHACRAM